ncbi:peptidoglycan/xylan/chitin deacetylase (PgdA/CDA1 family) [Pedobacter cryoconitis]|uniref:polysaccharide deacetylase family protein n=1 Tax=Pedobacter cryoconitis TaxID=188932 RepID=UPI0016183C11|nr:polysaccharide deacetylase family protein [Pedobacter cryoconitis]MBB6274143.1 peptidoglycan/xylan/chitin deacetylase (PgdA/CDA1 family) [Pedobacter cryoconitis]
MVLLSFDIEEFDMPFEYEKTITFEEQISISTKGTTIILDLLLKHQLKATFFSTVTFAKNADALIKRILHEGHELASHGMYHSDFKKEHLLESRLALEELSGVKVTGYRMARMMPVDEQEIQKAGYLYNSSINPTWLPGRYNNRHISRTYFYQSEVLQIPASVSPISRFPLFWLSFHNLPLWFYKHLAKRTYQKDNYLNIYFHPWEFTDLTDKERFGFPGYVSKNSGRDMIKRMDEFMSWINQQGYPSGTISQFTKNIPAG